MNLRFTTYQPGITYNINDNINIFMPSIYTTFIISSLDMVDTKRFDQKRERRLDKAMCRPNHSRTSLPPPPSFVNIIKNIYRCRNDIYMTLYNSLDHRNIKINIANSQPELTIDIYEDNYEYTKYIDINKILYRNDIRNRRVGLDIPMYDDSCRHYNSLYNIKSFKYRVIYISEYIQNRVGYII